MLVLVNRACTFLVVACVGACLAQVAFALDLNNFAVTPAQPQKPDWAGFYFRANPGSGADAVPWTTLAPSNGFASPAPANSPINENFGYNFQSGNFVFGLEGALAAANFDGRFTSPGLPPAGPWSPNMNWFGSMTGRLGYSFGQWLPYVKSEHFRKAQNWAVGRPVSASNTNSRPNGL
jgi:opacity protein-like surface antigen